MEDLIERVAASFARHGIECPAADSSLVWGRALSSVQAERSSAGARSAEATLTTALPEHNFRKSLQGDPAP
ncbi:MAG: hypothetical protein WBW53_22075 [Terriglobales bacterium]